MRRQGTDKGYRADARPLREVRTAEDPKWETYLNVAKRALNASLLTDRTDSLSNVKEHMKQLCAQDGIPYDSTTCGKAVEAAMFDCEVAKRSFLEQYRSGGVSRSARR